MSNKTGRISPTAPILNKKSAAAYLSVNEKKLAEWEDLGLIRRLEGKGAWYSKQDLDNITATKERKQHDSGDNNA